ncbi:2'-deoxynucleoside 5'-phosphate n-hydrolase 1-like [Plakobranchus ocellatus]|uniref:2'-deoxynucleoside 5'-phosphate n-hydrolase 1-like n=1 Tax=Plakobranchus ocellatus TaxID=259542 RepID=A0AAV4BCI1_9GAST|nr:2'-deoxynucleoside 5'-phosphate n-hydrolase 1-like [Plakobranchus ocellatus]
MTLLNAIFKAWNLISKSKSGMSQLNIYFAGSIKGGRQDVDIYAQIIELLKAYGHVFTEFVGDKNYSGPVGGRSDKDVHDTDVAMLQKSDSARRGLQNALTRKGCVNGVCVDQAGQIWLQRQSVRCFLVQQPVAETDTPLLHYS